MKFMKSSLVAVGASLLLVACGGGGGAGDQAPRVAITSLVSFGDSLSDVGNANVGTVHALGGGLYTVNSATAKNWTTYVAAQYGLPVPCAAMTGLHPVGALAAGGFVDVPDADHTECLNYAQGSSRITSTYGPHSVAERVKMNQLSAGSGDAAEPLGLTAITINAQIDKHLAAHGGFTGKELVTVLAGANDIFMNLGAVSKAAAGGATFQAAMLLADWDVTTIGTLAAIADPTTRVNATAGAAITYMNTAADNLATAIKNKIVANNAKYVLVMNVPDVSTSPFALATPSSIPLTNQLVRTFNTRLQSNLAGVSAVHIIDLYTNGRDEVANPAQYGLTNVTTPACDTTNAANPLQGSSLTCTTATTLAGTDTSRYLFADGVHFTPFEYQFIAQLVSKELLLAGWL